MASAAAFAFSASCGSSHFGASASSFSGSRFCRPALSVSEPGCGRMSDRTRNDGSSLRIASSASAENSLYHLSFWAVSMHLLNSSFAFS